MYGCLRVLEQLGTRGLGQMKGISSLLISYISDIQFIRSERSEEGFYSKIMHITKLRALETRGLRHIEGKILFLKSYIQYFKF